MSDEFSVFHPRMRKPAVIAIIGGLTLGVLAVGVQRTFYDVRVSWLLAGVLGVGATVALYAKMYVEMSNQYAEQS